jgi:hypothetical protein
MDLEPHQPRALPERLGRTEKTGGLLTVGISGQIRQAFQDARNRLINPRADSAGERIMGVTFRCFEVAFCNGDASSG